MPSSNEKALLLNSRKRVRGVRYPILNSSSYYILCNHVEYASSIQ